MSSNSVPSTHGGGTSSGGRHRKEEVVHNMKTIQPNLIDHVMSERNKTGSAGAVVNAMANYVRVKSHVDLPIYQFHVAFDPPVDNKSWREEILRGCGIFDRVLFDGAMMYSPERIEDGSVYRASHPGDNGVTVQVTVKVTATFERNDPQALHVFDLLIRRAMRQTNLVCVARHYFDPKGNFSVENYPLECWPGYHTATRLHDDGMMVCIENKWKVLRSDTILNQFIKILRRTGSTTEAFWAESERLVKDQTVLTIYNNRMYRLTGIDRERTARSEFTMANGSTVSFGEYFTKQYGIDEVDMEQPLLYSEGKPKQPGEPPQRTYLLPQLCHLTGITDEMRNDMLCMRAMSKVTRLTPDARLDMTRKWLRKVREMPDLQEFFRHWGFELDEEFIHFPARRLDEELCFGRRPGGYKGEKAEWARQVKSNGNYRSAAVNHWMVVAPNTQQAITAAQKFIAECKSIGRQINMDLPEPHCFPVGGSGEANDYLDVIREKLAEAANHGIKLDMLVVILKDDNKTRYDTVKKVVCVDLPVPSQCVRVQTLIGRPSDGGVNKQLGSICLKILLQMNCKMGGAPWIVKMPPKRVMFIGYDLYADSTTRGKCAGSCVSSFDQDITAWYSQCKAHENPQELGTNLGNFVRKALKKYIDNNNNQLPEKFFLYRDGVGDGQIPNVRKQEVPLVRQAAEEVAQTMAQTVPQFAFILVTKKTNTRVFTASGNSAANPLPGTVVDNYITRPERYDFYMVPQAVNQGTVAPVHYSIIHDDTGYDADRHHKLAFKLCHLYYNWQGTVRVPAPCQYAHKLAFLFAQTLHREANEQLRDKLFYL
ncbi:unnamed protein product, partial [Mesorhabditis spiculigera]